MMKRFFSVVILISCLSKMVSGQRIAELQMSSGSSSIDVPVSVNLDEITYLSEAEITLMEVKGNQRIEVPYQIENRGERIMHWLMKPESDPAKPRTYELIKKAPKANVQPLSISKETGALIISTNQKPLLQYNYNTHYPPEGIDTIFKRSGFIHPLWTPNGQTLTRINPTGHFHHYGLWNPWTTVLFEGEIIDFWNLQSKKGTVRFSDFVSINTGEVYGEYQTLHEHIAFTKTGEKPALNELQTVRIYETGQNQDYYFADITIQLNCASNSPVILKEYRYGGLVLRGTEKWNKSNSENLTSAGKVRNETDGTKARWIIVQGSLDEDYGGVLMMSFPTNYNHPEPLRVWPDDMNENGDVFVNFTPTKDKDWVLEPAKNYVLKYRLMVFNNKLSKEKAEDAWQAFTSPPKVSKLKQDEFKK